MRSLLQSPWPPLELVLAGLALIAHQLFKRFEVFSLLFHASLLLVPPAIVAIHAMCTPLEWPSGYTFAYCYAMYLSTLCPILCRTSIFWHAIQTTTGQQMRYLKTLHETYGDVVRIGPNHVSIRDPSVMRTLLGAPGVPKSSSYKGTILSDVKVSLVGIQDIEEHGRRRRPWSRGLAPTALRHYEHTMATRVLQLVTRLEEQQGPVAIGEWFNYLAYDFMSDMAFGGGSELMQEGDKNNVWSLLEKGMAIMLFLGHVPWLGIYLGRIPGAGGPLNKLIVHSRREAMKRLARGSSTRDLFYYLNNEDLPSKAPPPTSQLVDDGILAIIGGADTTSSALTSTVSCLLAHRTAYAALQDEVDRFYPEGEDVCSTKHRDMHYLTAVINETLRLFPPVPTNGARQVPHSSDPVVVGSVVLPPGTIIHIPPYVLHRDLRNFIFPDAFWPERWLVASGLLSFQSAMTRLPADLGLCPDDSVQFVHNDAAFIPFYHGPMNCVGKGLAMQQMRMVVCALVHKFRFRLKEGRDPRAYEEAFRDYLVANRPELPVLLEARW